MTHRFVLFGSGGFGEASFEQLRLDPNVEIAAVITQPARPSGRSNTLQPTPIERWATQNELSVLRFETLRTDEAAKAISDLRADTFLTADYGCILPQTILDLPSNGCLNIHASLLPNYRGAAPIPAAILDGVSEVGTTLMVMDASIDTGPILRQHQYSIDRPYAAPELEQALADLAAKEIVADINGFWSSQFLPQPQPAYGKPAPKLKRSDGQAVWHEADREERKIRAYDPWPGVWTTWKGQILKITAATADRDNHQLPPGTIWRDSGKTAIACQRGSLILATVQLAGRQPMPIRDFVNGYADFIGSTLPS